MALGNFTSNQGTQTPIIVDTIGGSVMAVQKVDISPLGADGTIWDGNVGVNAGTITALPNLPGGTLTNLASGTINSATVVINSATISVLPNTPGGTLGLVTRVGNVGTLEVGTITTLPNIPGGSIVVTAGTIAAHAITAATITEGTLRNLISGTINAATAVINSATISVLPNLPQGSINVTAGTVNTGTVNTGTINVATVTAGSIRVVAGTVGGAAATAVALSGNPIPAGGVDGGGTVYGLLVDTKGQQLLGGGTVDTVTTVSNLTNGSVRITVGTITVLPNLPQGSINVTAGTIATLGTMGTLGLVNTVTTVTTVSNVSNGTIRVTEGTIAAGTIGGKAASGAAASGNPVFVGGTATSGSVYGLLTDTAGVLQINGTVSTGGAGTQAVRLIDGTLTLGTVVGKDANAAAQTGNPLAFGGTDSGGTIRTVLVDATGALKTTATLSSGTTVTVDHGSIAVTTGTVNAGTINTGTINTGTVSVAVGTVNHGTIDVGTITVGTVYKGVSAGQAGSLTAAGTLTAAGSQLDLTYWDIGGTWVGTAFFEAQVGTSAYFAANVITPTGAIGTLTTGNGDYMQSMAGIDNARLRVTYSSGTLTYNNRSSNFFAPLHYTMGGTIGNIGMVNAATISTLPNIPGGSIVVTAGTVTQTTGTVNTGTINAATVNTGTINTGTINVATITAGTLTNLVSGTINSATAVVNSATISVLPNLPQGSINVTAGTVAVTAGTLTAGTLKDNLGALGTFTISLGTLASSTAGAGRQSVLIDNTTNLFSGAVVAAQITVGSVTTANNFISLYLIRSDNSSIRDDAAGTGDAAWTQKNAPLIGNILVPTVGTTVQYQAVFDTAGLGHLGPQWGVGVVQSTGNNLHTTAGSHVITYTPYNARF